LKREQEEAKSKPIPKLEAQANTEILKSDAVEIAPEVKTEAKPEPKLEMNKLDKFF
jgi:hypothetical protein